MICPRYLVVFSPQAIILSYPTHNPPFCEIVWPLQKSERFGNGRKIETDNQFLELTLPMTPGTGYCDVDVRGLSIFAEVGNLLQNGGLKYHYLWSTCCKLSVYVDKLRLIDSLPLFWANGSFVDVSRRVCLYRKHSPYCDWWNWLIWKNSPL